MMLGMEIRLSQLYQISNPKQYKLHLASWNGKIHPLDEFVKDRAEWDEWNEYRKNKDDFNRKYIFALIDYYPKKGTWLFGGVYEVLSRDPTKKRGSYTIELLDESKPLIGRVKIDFTRPGRNKALNFERYYQKLIVSEILQDVYTGEAFCGYDQIDVDFNTLHSLIENQRGDWKAPLENVKGVYLITDISNGKRYVGSAYGVDGIWSRWKCYVETGHGYNDELTRLIKSAGIKYARKNFRFALLEHQSMKTDDNFVIARENYWKSVLMTRTEYGYNKN